MVIWGLYNVFGQGFNQNIFRNEFPDHENIGIGTSIEFLGAIAGISCHNACEIITSEPFSLRRNGYLGPIHYVSVRLCLKYLQK